MNAWLRYIAGRLAYAIAVLIGVNLITFTLFFAVNTPDDMARLNLGGKRVTPDAIEKWKAARGYNKPLLLNTAAAALRCSQTPFFTSAACNYLYLTLVFLTQGVT